MRGKNYFVLGPLIWAFISSHLLVPLSAENVLFLLPLATKSHKNMFVPLISEMAVRNHSVVVVSPFMPSKTQARVREMVPTDFGKWMEDWGSDPIERRKEGNMASWFPDYSFVVDTCAQMFENEEFMALINQKFDLVYVNAFVNDCVHGFVHKLGAPFILMATVAAPNSITIHTGNRLPPSFVPSLMLDYSDSMSFFQRMQNLALNFLYELHGDFMYLPKCEAVYKKYLGQDLPGVYELLANASAIFMNSHYTMSYPRPALPDNFEVGGMHCRPAQPLPKHIEEFVSGAKDGFIYFSLGSIIQANTMPEEVRKTFLNVFSRLKQRIVWKWETEQMADLPTNVKLLKWAPQQDILGHKNIKMFITHGGGLSTLEATYHGVALVGIPFFGDQDLNMATAERAGYALPLEILGLTEETLERTINRILNENKFSEKAKELSTLLRDQKETPLERAVYWSEYIMRHKGAKHMRSAARDLNFIQYHSLDVIAFLILIIFGSLWLTKIILFSIFRKFCLQNKSNSKIKRN